MAIRFVQRNLGFPLLPPGPPVMPGVQFLAQAGQRDIGNPISPVPRLFDLPQSVPTAIAPYYVPYPVPPPVQYAVPVDRSRFVQNTLNRRLIIGQTLLNRFAPAINTLMPAKLRRPVTRYIAPYRPGNEFVNRPNVSLGYEGPGTYLVVARNGLNIRPGPSSNSGYSLGVIPFESTIQVVGDAGDGWLQVVNVIGRRVMGYMCISCVEAPGGPWLVLLDRSRDDVLNPNGAVG